ncbi:VWA domain-containing protein [Natronolimnohabitans innermongolicus]|uniref:Protporphyrin IX magnesium chelatase n=1 Tax=Natronolimnohabitans innermongolicus JCM 12255 TaxID=1227499 RepID=L9XJF2_9EURY|nr:VWA domain-containing protein [Natronolimnohabitans innermongolicus]ELY60783.1 protporphyrin IX magnesium chelatase [Natronolimnohabitans innermongolicus JCM 12255]
MVAESEDKKLSSLPVPAIVGQAELKRVLFAVAANDGLDGALIVGEKGTAKSTAVRGLVDLLPEQRAVADCPYGCDPDEPSAQCASCRERDCEELPVETRPVPLVMLPLGATRDRVVGTLSVEDALAGESSFDPGLLARAHRGVLYVDEVNLLDDHLVDVILDAAASGVNTVERDGVSVSHPADFTLIGTMNPEEGDLRPQLRDRFALQATVEGCRAIDDRVAIIDRALERDDTAGDSDPWTEYAEETAALRARIVDARRRLDDVTLPDDFKREIAELCLEAGVDGHRGDVATARTAMALAALEGRTTVVESDVREAASYTLPHRLRSTPFEDEPDLEDVLEDRFEGDADDGERGDDGDSTGDGGGTADGDDEASGESEANDGGETGNATGGERGDGPEPEPGDDGPDGEREPGDNGEDGPHDESEPETDPGSDREPTDGGPAPAEAGGGNDDASDGTDSSDDHTDEADEDERAQPLVPGQRRGAVAEAGEARAPDLETRDVDSDGREGTNAGGSRASTTPSAANRGARVRTEPASGDGPIDAAASVRSAATRGESRVRKRDLRRSVRIGETSATIVFAVDASASMRPAMRTAKGVVLELLRDSYEHRDEVAVVAFAGEDAEVLLPPTDSVSLAARHLKELPSGDRTPLPAGLETSRAILERAETDASVVVLVTDGRANVADGSPTDATRRAARGLAADGATVIVVDAGDDSRAGLSALVADETDGELVPLESLSVETVRAAADRAAADE